MAGLRFEAQRWIYAPAEIQMLQGCLLWDRGITESGWLDPDSRAQVKCDIAECLEAFVLLSEGDLEAVIAFARQYGVLGIAPVGVEMTSHEEDTSQPGKPHLRYAEASWVYQNLALQAKSILTVMAALRAKQLVDALVLMNCFSPVQRIFQNQEIMNRMSRRQVYNNLIYAARKWSEVASYKFVLNFSREEMGPVKDKSPMGQPAPVYEIRFGDWNDGAEWDMQRMGRVSWEHHPGGHDCIKDILSENDTDYDDPVVMSAFAQELPAMSQRPSPLFNVLAFQLTQALTIPEGMYFCDHCGNITAPKDGGRKPQKNGRWWNCSAKCKLEHDSVYQNGYDNETRKQKKSTKKQAAPA